MIKNNIKIELFCGDSLEIMKQIENESIDLIVTDPPYKMTKRGKSCRPNWMHNNMKENLFDGDLPNFKQWLSLCYLLLKKDAHIYIFTNTVSLQEILNSATDSKFKLHNLITMIKDTNMPNRWYLKQTELILFFRKGKAFPINDMTSRDWFHASMPTLKNNKIHITQKPVEPLKKLITNSSKEYDIVLDLFSGSCSSAIACIETNRSFIGIEKDVENFNKAVIRVKDYIKENNIKNVELIIHENHI